MNCRLLFFLLYYEGSEATGDLFICSAIRWEYSPHYVYQFHANKYNKFFNYTKLINYISFLGKQEMLGIFS